MARYTVTSPDGQKFAINAPDGANQDQVLAYAQAQFSRIGQQREAGAADMQRLANPTGSFLENFNAGMGKAFTDLGRGAAQLVNAGPSAQEMQDIKKQDQPLMQTGGGVAGNVSGNIAALAPAALLPVGGALGAGALGASLAALQPTENVGERLTNMGAGGALAAGAQFAGTTGAQLLGEKAAEREAAAKALAQQNSVRDTTALEAHKAGYVFPPSATTNSFAGRRLESIAGKAAIGQEASIRNQKVTDAILRQEGHLGPNEPITIDNLKKAREALSVPYEEIGNISPTAKRALEQWKQSKALSNKWYSAYDRMPLPSTWNRAERTAQVAAQSEQLMEAEAQAAGRADLLPALRQARTEIAKSYNIERALNLGSGEVDAAYIGKLLDSGKKLSGGLELVAKTQQAFPSYMKEGGKIPTPGVSKSEAIAAAILATGGAAAGGPAGLLAGALPLASTPTRSVLLSKPVQDAIANSGYGPGMLVKEAAMLNDPVAREELAKTLRAIAYSMTQEKP